MNYIFSKNNFGRLGKMKCAKNKSRNNNNYCKEIKKAFDDMTFGMSVLKFFGI